MAQGRKHTSVKRRLLFIYIFTFLRSGIKAKRGVEIPHAMPEKFNGNREIECLNTRLPLPTLFNI